MFSPFSNPIMVIARQKMNGGGEHFGVQLANDRVAHYTAEQNLRITSIDEFSQGKDVRIEKVVPYSAKDGVQQRLNHIYANPRPYHLTEWNCEIFANWLIGEKPMSKQVNNLVILGAFFAGIALLGSSN